MNSTSKLSFRTREKHARKLAEQLGVRLDKCRRRSMAWNFRQFMIVDPYSSFVLEGAWPLEYSMSIDDVEGWLARAKEHPVHTCEATR